MATTNQKPLKPLHKIKVGSAQVAIWQHFTEKGNEFLTATVSRSYKDKDGEWQNGHSFTVEQMESAIDALTKAKQFMREERLKTKAA